MLAWGARFLRKACGEPMVLLRVGLALLMLIRHEDFLRGLVPLEHFDWGGGREFGAQSLAPKSPAFLFPLIPAVDRLLPWSELLCNLRVATASLLLFGVLPRLNAALLGLIGLTLLFGDGLRYLHHLLILYVSTLLLAFAAPGELTGSSAESRRGLWVLRLHLAVVYGAAGLGKCTSAWWSGRTLEAFANHGFFGGPIVEAVQQRWGMRPFAWGAVLAELALPVLLLLPKTRLWGVALGFLLHLGIELTMDVSTFGATMMVLLLAYLPAASEGAGSRLPGLRVGILSAAVALLGPGVAALLDTKVSSYRMFTSLVHYELKLAVDGQPVSRQVLVPHLGRDGARIMKLANGRGIGETNVEILGRALPELGAFVCKIRPDARDVRLTLLTRRIEEGNWTERKAIQRCR